MNILTVLERENITQDPRQLASVRNGNINLHEIQLPVEREMSVLFGPT